MHAHTHTHTLCMYLILHRALLAEREGSSKQVSWSSPLFRHPVYTGGDEVPTMHKRPHTNIDSMNHMVTCMWSLPCVCVQMFRYSWASSTRGYGYDKQHVTEVTQPQLNHKNMHTSCTHTQCSTTSRKLLYANYSQLFWSVWEYPLPCEMELSYFTINRILLDKWFVASYGSPTFTPIRSEEY